jgi:soluble lytic murein transglycosylase-like protein
MSLITATGLCLAITAGAASDAPLYSSGVKIACKHSQDLIDAANAYKISPFVLAGLVWVESRWKPTAISRSNACGLTQVLPKYVYEDCDDLMDPRRSLFVGAMSLRKWFFYQAKYRKENRPATRGGMRVALACYNGGTRCDRIPAARRYSWKVMKISRWYYRWYRRNVRIRS